MPTVNNRAEPQVIALLSNSLATIADLDALACEKEMKGRV